AEGEIDHQRDVAVGDRRQQEAALEPRQTSRHVGPRGKAMPREIEIARRVLREPGNPEPRQNAIEIFPVQQVELAEGPAAGTYVLQGGPVLPPPRTPP